MKRPVASGLTCITNELISMRSSVVSRFVAASLWRTCFGGHSAEDFRRTSSLCPSQGGCVSISGVLATSATIRLTRAILIRPGMLDGDFPRSTMNCLPATRRISPRTLKESSFCALSTMRAGCARPLTRPIGSTTLSIKSDPARPGTSAKAPGSVANLSTCGGPQWPVL